LPRTPGLLGDHNIQELSEERFVGTLVCPVADADGATLTVREREADPRVTPAGLAWRLVDDRHVEITRPTGPSFDPGAIYEFIYRARDPIVMGIGFAAIRDIVSFLRHETKDNPLAPQERPRIRHALGFGISQSGRVLRDLVHLGFNQDLAGRQVFDGILPVVAGSATHLRQPAVRAGRSLFAPFPRLPGVKYPGVLNELRLRDHSVEPPIESAAYPVFVLSTDADGNALGGIRHPLLAAPLGTHAGWSVRAKGYGEGELFTIQGSMIPFAQTEAERLRADDPRPSLEARYASRDAWAARLAEAMDQLVAERLLLAEDGHRLATAARESWDVYQEL
jgi:Alpha/beta hydrolase domain